MAFEIGLKVKIFIGGTPVEDDPHRVKKCHIAVGTPGRLAHLIKDYDMDLSKIRVFVLDEADKLLDQSFFNDIQFIFATVSKHKQILVASATYPDGLDDFVLTFMRNPVKVQMNSSTPALLAVEQVAIDIRKAMEFTPIHARYAKEDELLFCKLQCLKEVLRRVPYTQGIVFCSHQFKYVIITKDLDLT
jgi:ATP-dependent RNA helicase DDX20